MNVKTVFELSVEPRAEIGRTSSRRFRKQGKVPAVLYGGGEGPESMLLDHNTVVHQMNREAFFTSILTLKIGAKSQQVVVKDVQRHPVKRQVSHIDFLQINMKELLTVAVPLRLEGEAKAVMAGGGLVDPAVDAIEVECTPDNMPNEFVVDITDMQPGDVIRLSELPMPKGVTALGDPEMAIVTAIHGTEEIVDEPVAAAEGDAAADEAAE